MIENPFEREPVLVTIHQDGLFSEPTFTVSKADYDKLKGENDQLWRDVERLRAQLAACAAGPWRFDVENAPRDGSEVWCEFHRFGRVVRTAATWQSLGGYWGTFTDATFEARHLHAFAVPNPPQVKP